MSKLLKNFKNKRIFITGVCGTVGSEILKLLLTNEKYSSCEIIAVDNRESELFFIEQIYSSEHRVDFYIADVRDYSKLARLMNGIDIVFHVAALKHVVLCERSPFEAVQTNIHGVKNIIQAANENNVKTVIFTSSDKAVNPTNVMGTSKLMGERLITAANIHYKESGTVFASTRFGNVLGSSGSVIPIFQKQVAKGGPVTLTDRKMTRFVMTVGEAASLVVDSALLAQGGEVFVTKMPVISIKDLAEVIIDKLASNYGYESENIKIVETGAKPGEKLYEELVTHEETRRTIELEKYFLVIPAFTSLYNKIQYDYPDTVSKKIDIPYISSNELIMGKNDLLTYLVQNDLISIG